MTSKMYDIAIYGDSSGAVASAIQAARLGREVVLISPHEHIGMWLKHLSIDFQCSDGPLTTFKVVSR